MKIEIDGEVVVGDIGWIVAADEGERASCGGVAEACEVGSCGEINQIGDEEIGGLLNGKGAGASEELEVGVKGGGTACSGGVGGADDGGNVDGSVEISGGLSSGIERPGEGSAGGGVGAAHATVPGEVCVGRVSGTKVDGGGGCSRENGGGCGCLGWEGAELVQAAGVCGV